MYKRICVAAKQGVHVDRGLLASVKEKFPSADIAQARVGSRIPNRSVKCDLLIVLGGDGTLLRGAMALQKPETPIFHVNMGRGGYLAEVDLKDIRQALSEIGRGQFNRESVRKVMVTFNGRRLPDASNEVALVTASLGGIAYFNLDLENLGTFEVEGNGIIVATPLGSTAFSLIAGGSVMTPDTNCLIVAPLLTRQRLPPFVIPSTYKVKVRVTEVKQRCIVLLDGAMTVEFGASDSLMATGSEHKINIIRLKEDFFHKRINKLMKLST